MKHTENATQLQTFLIVKKRTCQRVEAKPEENNRLGKDFQVAELGPIQGPFTNPDRRP